ncbi:hypothetical protein GC101_34180 [Paenibacillus sp. LMG 31459]|uniref:Uncharacterized protein n=1 Tax=Paenibacillus phytohabitans TaxID=2654978 RepID=A0ABX1YS41_9BACL|nr:hypothetical protein [Paenibacillus phytohabitans]NOU83905.1 hypothetical protein [Paenibacillus phytohabitans]
MSEDDKITPIRKIKTIETVKPIFPIDEYNAQVKRPKTATEIKQEEDHKQKVIDEQNKKDGKGNRYNERY